MKSILFFSLAGAAAALDFQGSGQIRTLWRNDTQPEAFDLGCLTSKAQWTADETLCDVYTGVRKSNSSVILTTSAGLPLGLDNFLVEAQTGLDSTVWTVS